MHATLEARLTRLLIRGCVLISEISLKIVVLIPKWSEAKEVAPEGQSWRSELPRAFICLVATTSIVPAVHLPFSPGDSLGTLR